MPTTFDSIATKVIDNTTTANVSFTNITSSYTDLVLHAHTQGSSAFDLYIRFNDDTGSNYNIMTLDLQNNTAINSSQGVNQTTAYLDNYGYIGVNSFSPSFAYIVNYANTNWNKTFMSHATNVNPAEMHGVSLIHGTWNSTAAITKITLHTNNATRYFSLGTTFSLYGITKA